MVSDQEIARGLETLLRQSDPNSLTSFDALLQQLEAKLGFNLSHKAPFIRSQINILLRSYPTTAPPASVISPQPPPSLLHHQPHLHPRPLHLSQFDHFALQHHSHLQQFPSHFALHPHRYHHHPQSHIFSQDLSFRQPSALQPPQQRTSLSQQQQKQQPPPTSSNDAASKTGTLVPSESPKEGATVGAKRRGGPGGLNKVCGVSPELQAVVGEPALPRTEIVKQLWAYIRKNNLQDPSNKRKINCDDALRVVFETDCTDMFKMNKLLSKHIIPLEPTKSAQAKRMKVDVEPANENTEPGTSIIMISEALAKFLETGGREMTQLEASKRVWEYIKVNRLEDPVNAMVIQCDAKLRELLGCESISAVGVEEMLARHHLLKRS